MLEVVRCKKFWLASPLQACCILECPKHQLENLLGPSVLNSLRRGFGIIFRQSCTKLGVHSEAPNHGSEFSPVFQNCLAQSYTVHCFQKCELKLSGHTVSWEDLEDEPREFWIVLAEMVRTF